MSSTQIYTSKGRLKTRSKAMVAKPSPHGICKITLKLIVFHLLCGDELLNDYNIIKVGKHVK
jgi:hypothetical protein